MSLGHSYKLKSFYIPIIPYMYICSYPKDAYHKWNTFMQS